MRSVSFSRSTFNVGIKIILLIFALFSYSAYAGPKITTYQAKINKPDGEPLLDASVNFRFTVMNPAGTCTLYVENFPAIDLSNTNGFVALPLGSGTRVFPTSGTTAFSDVFDNTSGSILCLTSGGAHSTYTPTEVHDRKIVMQFQDQLGWQTLPAMSINAVPYANYADKSSNSLKLNGKADTAFVERASLPICITGQALYFDGLNFTCVNAASGSGTGTVNNIASGNSYISIASGTTPVITLNVGTAANTVAAGDDSRILGAAQRSNNLSDLTSSATARVNLGLGSLATQSSLSLADVTTALGYTPSASGSVGVGALLAANDLSDVASATAARINLGLGSLATLNSLSFSDISSALSYTPANSATVGALQSDLSAVSVVAGSKITSSAVSIAEVLGYVPAVSGSAGVGTLLSANNLSDVASATVARDNLGLGIFATRNSVILSDVTTALGYTPPNSTTVTTAINTKITSSAVSIAEVLGYVPAVSGSAGVGTLLSVNNLSDLASATIARDNLGLGIFATRNSVILSDVTTALGYTPPNSTTVTTAINTKITSSAVSVAEVLGYVPAVSGSAGVGTLLSANNLSDVVSATVARDNLGLGIFATRNSVILSDVTTALGYTPPNSATVTTAINTKITSSAASIEQVLGFVPANSASLGNYLLQANNLSDVTSATVARDNLGLGLFATRNSVILSDVTTALGYTPPNSTTVTTAINTKITSSAASIAQVLGYVPAVSGSAGVGTLLAVNNLSDVTSATVARDNLGLGTFATRNSVILSDVTTALGYTPPNSATVTTAINTKITSSAASIAQVLGFVPANSASLGSYLLEASNLSDLASATVARDNLGLGTFATRNSVILSDVTTALGYTPPNSATVTTAINTKITSSAASIAQVLGFVPANSASLGNYLLEASNLSDLASATVARSNLGLGSVAILNAIDLSTTFATGTLAAARLPAYNGDVTSVTGSSTLTVDGIQGRPVLATAPTSGHALAYNGTAWAPAPLGDFEKDGSVAMTGQLQAISGTAAAPGYTFSGDTNTGIFSPAAETVAVTTLGSERIRVTSSGNVGIGTSAPGGGTRVRVSGQVAPTSFSTAGAAIDWSGGNTATTSYDCALGSISFSDMNDGGAYTLAVTSTTTAQCNFSTAITGDGAATVTYRFLPANAARTATSHSIYSFQRIGNVIYVSWLTGF